MRPEDVPMGDRILPGDKCQLCGSELEPIYEAGDEEDTVFISCPFYDDPGDKAGMHTEHNGQPRATLKAWGWKI